MFKGIRSLIFIGIMLLIDWYVFSAINSIIKINNIKNLFNVIYVSISLISVAFIALMPYMAYKKWQRPGRTYLFATIIGLFLAKFLSAAIFLIDDLRRLLMATLYASSINNSHSFNRSPVMLWIGLCTGIALFLLLVIGFKNKYNYQLKKVELFFENLPQAFKGLRIIHISDIHSGSFMNKEAVQRGVDLINAQQADIILFTGDLVNNKAEEMDGYIEIFNQLSAPLGVYSVLGNHDYGDYYYGHKPSGEVLIAKQKNLEALIDVHSKLGWRLLMDEHVAIEKDADAIALIGVQNTSGKAFTSYGNLQKAYNGATDYPFKILMSHDPSHWEHEVQPEYPDIDLTLSGHTHGMQFGFNVFGLKWSPVRWMYKQWLGLYEKNGQKLYVNSGFGFIGYPGRVGILPEITVIELK